MPRQQFAVSRHASPVRRLVALAIWFDYKPSGMSPAFYTEKMQHAIRVFTIPLLTVVVLGMFFTIAAVFIARSERPNFYFLIAATVCIVAVALITRFGNIPINNQILSGASILPRPIGQSWRRRGGGCKRSGRC
jgi:hypothetical protein